MPTGSMKKRRIRFDFTVVLTVSGGHNELGGEIACPIRLVGETLDDAAKRRSIKWLGLGLGYPGGP
jgi:tRNA A37 threonylcarbamoyltransferase TsaD